MIVLLRLGIPLSGASGRRRVLLGRHDYIKVIDKLTWIVLYIKVIEADVLLVIVSV